MPSLLRESTIVLSDGGELKAYALRCLQELESLNYIIIKCDCSIHMKSMTHACTTDACACYMAV